MAIKPLIGKNVKIEVALTFGAAKVITGITKANPGVVTSTSHALTANTIGFLSGLVGCEEIEGMAVSVGNPTANSFDLTNVNTLNFGTAATAGNFTPVLTWATLNPSTSLSISVADPTSLDVTTLIDLSKQEDYGMLGAETATINILSPAVSDTALTFIENAARSFTDCVFRVTFPGGQRIVWRGLPTAPGVDMSMDAAATGGINCKIRARHLKLL